jgi:hypothetical protein
VDGSFVGFIVSFNFIGMFCYLHSLL